MSHRFFKTLAASSVLALGLLAPAWGQDAAKAPATAASAAAPAASSAGLDTRIQEVKGDVIRLNRDLLVLEEELLFPASTQLALFV